MTRETLLSAACADGRSPEAGYLYFLLLGRAYLFIGDVEPARVNLGQALGTLGS